MAAAKAVGSSRPWLYSSQRAGAQISAWSRLPRTRASASRPANSRRPCRDEDPTLAVELRLEGPGEQLPLEQARVGIGHGQAPDLRRELVPGRHREDREAGVEPPRDHAAVGELRAETSRDGDAPLARRPRVGTRR